LSRESSSFQASAVALNNDCTLLRVSKNPPVVLGSQHLLDAMQAIHRLQLGGGKGIYIDGPMTLPIAAAYSHLLSHLYGFVAVFDPKLRGFVVAVSHSPEVELGQILPYPTIRQN
jgi:hypothetical protein